MRSHKLQKTISLVMAVILLFFCVPANALEMTQEAASPTVSIDMFAGKTLSVLGESISTFSNHSNGTAAQTTNSTIASGAVYYPRSGFEVTAESTWWYQAAKELGMDILVNNSWSGSCLLNQRSGTVGAYLDRCVQLHDDTGDNAGQQPDIIAVFLGTNDYYTYPTTLGSYEDVDFDQLIQKSATGYTYAQPTTSMEAYAIILHKIGQAYPDAQVYCFTLLPRVNSTAQPTAFNADICQLAQRFSACTVDLYNCGIRSNSDAFYTMMGDTLHPDNPGMDAITNAFVSTMMKHNGLSTVDVSFELENAVAMEGTTRTVVNGSAFETTLASLDASRPLEVTVTMGGEDITASCFSDNTVTIPSVTENVIITAKQGQREPMSFRWETQNDALVSITSDGNEKNKLTMTHGTITDGVFSKTRFTMSQGINLRHDLPWCVEWKSAGTWTDTTDGALLFAESTTSSTPDAYYLYRRHNSDFLAFGYSTGGKYYNYGVTFAGTGIDATAEHIYRLENRPAEDGSNMVYLLVDGEEAGPMNHHFIGGTDQKKTVDWVNGKDFHFSYMGTSPHTIGNCSIEYIQVWENGQAEASRELTDFRWEYDDETDAFVSVTHSGNTENPLIMTGGTITDGYFAKTRFTLSETVMLNHDSPWIMEWKASGYWTDTTDGALLFAEAPTSTTEGSAYLYRRHKNTFFSLGICENGKYHNYAADIAGTGIDTAEEHVYRLENRINADGSNMVYLLVDGEDVGPMNRHYIGGTDQKETVDWVCGKDFRFSYMGTTPHTIGGGTLEYMQIMEKGHIHHYVNGICTGCGDRQISTFRLLDTRTNQVEIFSYAVGMTWKEWLNSEYNTGMGSCIAVWVSAGPDILGENPAMDIFVNGCYADYDEVIHEQEDIRLVRYP